jgi:hypothetical protein
MDNSTTVSGILVDIDAVTNRALVSVNGAEGIWMPYADATYVEGEMVMVSRNPMPGATAMYCLGPIGGTPGVTLPTAPGAGATTEQAIAVISPEWTGTWRAIRSAYDRWNIDRASYGGRPTLYQGDAFGSGALTGLALYGDQIVNLGAISIESITVSLRSAGLASEPGSPMEFRAATNTDTSGAPAVAGATMTGPALAKGATGSFDLDASVLEGFRNGTYKALATAGTGSEYNAVRGTSDADGMVLTVNYTRAI